MRTAALVLAALAIATTTASAQGNGEAGARYYQHWAQDGTLVGDMQGYGAFAMFPLRTDWSLGVSVDRLYYDMETPVDVTGIGRLTPSPSMPLSMSTGFERTRGVISARAGAGSRTWRRDSVCTWRTRTSRPA